MQPLEDIMREMFENDPEVSTMINTGVLPLNIADIAARAMEEKSEGYEKYLPDVADSKYWKVAALIADRFFPDAPLPEEDKFCSWLAGKSKAPRSAVLMAVSAQIQSEVAIEEDLNKN